MADANAHQLLNTVCAVSHETFEQLSIYRDILLKWQSKINLIGPDTVQDIWTRHFLDSLQLATIIPNRNQTICDIGTGAGFPGLVLAIVGYHNVHLIDSDLRKTIFLKEVKRLTSTNVHIHQERIEHVALNKVDVVVSRACASLDQLFSIAEHVISRETICLFHKGKNYTKELDIALKMWSFDVTVIPSMADPQSVILKISHLSRRGHDDHQSINEPKPF